MGAGRPNILFIMTDDHASHPMSCYGSRINQTPNLDRIANGGIQFDNCFCTNSICTPEPGHDPHEDLQPCEWGHNPRYPDGQQVVDLPQATAKGGYQTDLREMASGHRSAHCPTGFDDWAVLPGQGRYHNPEFIFKGPDGGTWQTVQGYATDIITDMSLDWLRARDPERPFCLLCHHKAPHRPWYSDEKHAAMYLNEEIAEPETLYDTYENRATAAAAAEMRVGPHMDSTDLKCEVPTELPEMALRKWAYQRYIKDYLRVVASVDDNVGRLLDYLRDAGLEENTVVIYTSDQGFFLGDHGWYDKRFMYEESLRMPFVLRYPREVTPGSTNSDIVLNVDFAPLFLDLAGISIPESFQGRSFRQLLQGSAPADWREAMYYRYWMHKAHHNVYAHYGIRTRRHKLIYYYADALGQAGTIDETYEPEWELFDLLEDPRELRSVYHDPAYTGVRSRLTAKLHRLQAEVGDIRYHKDKD